MENVTYRQMLDSDHGQVIPLWMETWGYTDYEFLKRRIGADPAYMEHTFLAASPDGEVLATVHYWLFDLRDVDGRPRRVGCVSNVVTKEKARKQGHARRLMEMALDRMPRDGCEWTLLFTSEMGRPLYLRLGYRAYSLPYARGTLSGAPIPLAGGYTVTRSDLTPQPGYWQAIAPIYEAYNHHRPLTVARDAAYWQGLHVRKLERPPRGSTVHLFAAHSPQEGREVGYAIAYLSNREAEPPAGPEQGFVLLEIAIIPGHEEAIPHLLSAFADAAGGERVVGTSFLPGTAGVDEALRVLFEQPMEEHNDMSIMARPLEGGLSEEEVEAIMSAPNATFWRLDEF
ncbi:MAG TPA: GNAT family N-acetyltransferase [Chloroflexia bacterium]|nr:GNAT family N-acetyltransferase [Chloroflexia bacterium]